MKTKVRDNGSVKRLYVTKRKVHFLVSERKREKDKSMA